MNEEDKEKDRDSKKLWLLLLLLLLLIIFVIVGIVLFFNDSGSADALENVISNEIATGPNDESSKDKDKNENDLSNPSNVVAIVKTTTKQTLLTSASQSSGSAGSSSEAKQKVEVNIDDDSYFNEPVILEIAGNQYKATITDSNGKVTNYTGKIELSEDGTYTVTITEDDGTETTVSFVVDTTIPAIEGVEEKLYNTTVTPKVVEANLDEVILTKDGTKVDDYTLGDEIGNDGDYVLKVTDKAGNTAEVKFSIDRTAPTYTIDFTETALTNQDVVVTIEINEEIEVPVGWEKSQDGKSITKTFTENSEETVILKDKAGNETPVEVKVENIDRVPGVITVKSNSVGLDPYYSKISFSLSDDKLVDKFTINGKEFDRTDAKYSDANYDNIKSALVEGENTMVLYDVAGNMTTKTFIIDWTAPTVKEKDNKVGKAPYYSKISFSLSDNYLIDRFTVNGVNFDRSNSKYSDANYDNIKSALKNGENILVLYDVAGNSTEYKFIIDWIAPTITIKQNSVGTDPYYSKINFSLSDDKLVDKFTINGREFDRTDAKYSDANYDNIKSALVEGENTITLYDTAGNTTTKTFIIDWTAPTVKEKDNKVGKAPYYSKISFSLSDNYLIDRFTVNGVNFDRSNSKYSDANYDNIKSALKNGENILVLYDVAGNSTEYKFIIDWIAPTITIKQNSVGTDPYYSKINFSLSDDKLVDKFTINGKEFDRTDAKYSDANYDNIKSALVEGENTITLYDTAGNTTTKTFIIDWTKAELTITYSVDQNTFTNQDVKVTITSNEVIQAIEDWDKVSDKVYEKIYTTNKTEDVTVKDLAGNTTTAIVEVKNIDKVPPEVTAIKQEYEAKGGGRIKVTVTFSEAVQNITGLNDLRKVSDTEYYTYVYRTKTINLGFEDLAGNENTKVFDVDKTAPTATVIYSPDSLTNTDVVATITADEEIQLPSGWEYVDASTKLAISKTYSTNVEEKVTINDIIGNPTIVDVKVTNIDTTAPTASVSYSPDTTTNGNVVATITASETIKELNGWTKVNDTTYTKTYSANAEETVTIEDLAGNSTPVEVKVTNIDITAPTASVSYSPDTTTNGNVVVTITASEAIKEINGWTKVNDTTYTKSYSANAEETVTIEDLAGNSTPVEVKVTNIDTTAPTASVSYSPDTTTNGNVVATIAANEAIKEINGWTKVNDTTYTKTYSANAEETVTIEDLAGNTAVVNVSVTNINIKDETDPIVNEPVIEKTADNKYKVTISANEAIKLPDNSWSYVEGSDNKSITKIFEPTNGTQNIRIEDESGNSVKIQFKLENGKKTNSTPEPQQTFSIVKSSAPAVKSSAPVKPQGDTPVVTPTDKPVVTPLEGSTVTPPEEPTVTPPEEPVVTPTEEPVVTPSETSVVTEVDTSTVTPTEPTVVVTTPDVPVDTVTTDVVTDDVQV